MEDPDAPLYPKLEAVREISFKVALAVAREAHRAGLTEGLAFDELGQRLEEKMWQPEYVPLMPAR